jgi:pSer/pThr/pTyr-binding forkhead associated (FHA) protein
MADIHKLVLKSGDDIQDTFILEKGINSIGRDPNNNFVIDDIEISRNHLSVNIKDGDVFIEDLDSTNGSFLNGKRLKRISKIQNGDLLTLGKNIKIEFVEEAVEIDTVSEGKNELDSPFQKSDSVHLPTDEPFTNESPEQEISDVNEEVDKEIALIDKEQVNKFKRKKGSPTDSSEKSENNEKNSMEDVQDKKGVKLGQSLKKLPKWVIILFFALGFLVIFCLIPLLVIESTNQWCNLFAGIFNSIRSGACP